MADIYAALDSTELAEALFEIHLLIAWEKGYGMVPIFHIID